MNRKLTIYISGPMTGLPAEEYRRRFDVAAEVLGKAGYRVVNPARGWPHRLYRLLGYRLTLLWDLWTLSGCDFIVKLPGWKMSHGASIESCWAYHFGIWTPPRQITEEIYRRLGTKLPPAAAPASDSNNRKKKKDNHAQSS